MDIATILNLFKRAVREHKIKISLHAAEQALADEISRAEIEAVMQSAQLLEDYPDWWLGPSCLIYGRTEAGRELHIVVSYSGLPVTIITVYEPRPPRWIAPTKRGGRRR